MHAVPSAGGGAAARSASWELWWGRLAVCSTDLPLHASACILCLPAGAKTRDKEDQGEASGPACRALEATQPRCCRGCWAPALCRQTPRAGPRAARCPSRSLAPACCPTCSSLACATCSK